MRCECEYHNDILRLIVIDAGEYTDAVKYAYYRQEEDIFVKEFLGPFLNVETIMSNFKRLAPDMFGKGNWEKALLHLAKICKDNNIIWFLAGSGCDAVRGVNVLPHDLDVEIKSSDWEKAEKVFGEYIVEPFINTKGWVREYFGRLVVEGTQIDMVSDKRYDLLQHDYEPYTWNGYNLWLEPFMSRFRIEIERGRRERISSFIAFLSERGIDGLAASKM